MSDPVARLNAAPGGLYMATPFGNRLKRAIREIYRRSLFWFGALVLALTVVGCTEDGGVVFFSDWLVKATPGSIMVTQGNSFDLVLTIEATDGSGDNVVLSLTGEKPPGTVLDTDACYGSSSYVHVSFDPVSCTVTVHIPADAAAGEYAMMIYAEFTSAMAVDDYPIQVTVLPNMGVPSVAFSDDFAVGDEWTTTSHNVVNGADHSVSNPDADGNPQGYRWMEHVLPHTTGVAATQITVRHIYEGGTYDPCVDGAIDHINYFEDRIVFDPEIPGIPIGSAFLLEQNGLSFSVLVAGGGFNNLSWETGQLLMITSESFLTATKPDFSGSGTNCPIKFGFVRSNVVNWTTPLVLTHGIDNWRVEIFRSGG